MPAPQVGTRSRPGTCTVGCRPHPGPATLDWLGDRDAGQVRVVSNARVLTEGIDVPAIDAVCFADERSSVVDIIQAIGRVLRPCPGKRIGTIIVPITLPAAGDDDTGLLLSKFGVLWSVLRGLRAHDQRFAHELDAAVRSHARHGHLGGYRPARIHYRLPDGVNEDFLHLRVVQDLGDAWERYLAACEDWSWRHPSTRLPRNTVHQGQQVGGWAAKQRSAHLRGLLPAERARRLEGVPGWFWDRADAAWDDTFSVLQAFAAAYGSVAESDSAPSVFEGMRAAARHRELLGQWVAFQRQAYRDGTLDPARAELLEELAGWTWAPVPELDLAMVDALRQFVEFEDTADVPTGHVEDGLPLGRWVWDVRRRKLTGTLHPALEDEIWAATPSRWSKGVRRRWQWDKPETQWRLAYAALRQFTTREGHANPPTVHREQLPDIRVSLGQWVALQRHDYRHGRLDAARAAALAAFPGWEWAGDVGGTREFEEPLELPAHVKHGSSGALARRCHCEVCVLAARTYQREWKARRRSTVVDGTDAAPARRHLAELEDQLAAVIATDSDNHQRSPGRGPGERWWPRCPGFPSASYEVWPPGAWEHEARLRATTAQMCLSNAQTRGHGGGAATAAANASMPIPPGRSSAPCNSEISPSDGSAASAATLAACSSTPTGSPAASPSRFASSPGGSEIFGYRRSPRTTPCRPWRSCAPQQKTRRWRDDDRALPTRRRHPSLRYGRHRHGGGRSVPRPAGYRHHRSQTGLPRMRVPAPLPRVRTDPRRARYMGRVGHRRPAECPPPARAAAPTECHRRTRRPRAGVAM